jgi:hypothetical protein
MACGVFLWNLFSSALSPIPGATVPLSHREVLPSLRPELGSRGLQAKRDFLKDSTKILTAIFFHGIM